MRQMVGLGPVRVLVSIVALCVAFAGGHTFSAWLNSEQAAIFTRVATVTGLGRATDGDDVLVGVGEAVVDVRLYGIQTTVQSPCVLLRT